MGRRGEVLQHPGANRFLEDERKCLLALCPAGQLSSRPWLSVSERDWMFVCRGGYSSVGRSTAFPAYGCEPACLKKKGQRESLKGSCLFPSSFSVAHSFSLPISSLQLLSLIALLTQWHS